MIRLKLPHHTDDGFRNLFPGVALDSRLEDPTGAGEAAPPPMRGAGFVPPDREFLRRNRERHTLTWLGHSTFLLQIGGLNILTDPHLSEHARFLPRFGARRVVGPAMQAYQLPRIDAVVLSHDHADHFDRRTVKRLLKQSGGPPSFFVPLGVKALLGDAADAYCDELDWGQWAQVAGVVMHCVPAHHESGRTPWTRDSTLWCGWVIEHAGFRFYFAGDTGYSPALLDVGRRFKNLDLAALPIAGHRSRWRRPGMTLSPAQAVKLHRELGARHSVAMHWGTFAQSREPLDMPARRLAGEVVSQGLEPGEFFLMRVGDTLSLPTFTDLRTGGPSPLATPREEDPGMSPGALRTA